MALKVQVYAQWHSFDLDTREIETSDINLTNVIIHTGCKSCDGPGYRSPSAAMLEGPREKLIYVACVHTDQNKSDVLCTVDVDPDSPDYCKVR